MQNKMTRYDNALLSIFEYLKMADWEASMLETYAGRDGCGNDLATLDDALAIGEKIVARIKDARNMIMEVEKDEEESVAVRVE